MRAILRIFFHFLYHQFAFAYDLVAATVSLGHWKSWILEVIPFIEGTRTLEIGHGPGHLQRVLLSRGLDSVAIDESAFMSRLAMRNLNMSLRGQRPKQPPLESEIAYPKGHTSSRRKAPLLAMTLTRGLGQQLPFRDGAFDTVIATFPAEYITETRTLSDVKRCLSDGGRFIVLPVAMPKNRFLSWLYRVTGETPSNALEFIQERMEQPFVQAGFDVETNLIERESGTLIVIVASISGRAERSVDEARDS